MSIHTSWLLYALTGNMFKRHILSYNSEFGELGVLTIDGKEYFPATQCAKILGHENPARAVRKYCNGVTEMVTPTNGGNQTTKYIPEGDLYRLIIRSKLPSAIKFESWVFDEVLPELRRNGSYGNSINLEEVISKTATAVVSEVMKQIIPIFESDTIRERTETESIRRKRAPGIIDKLDPVIIKEVEEMLMSNRFSYLDVVNYLNDIGVEISIGSVHRYAKRMRGLK